MYSKQRLLLALLTLLLLLTPKLWAEQESVTPDVEFEVSPTKCVTMEEGRQCYADIRIIWKSQSPLDACLMLNQQRLQCWTQQYSAQLEFGFTSSESATLRLQQGPNIFARQDIQVSWVHSESRRRGYWRLF